MKKSLLFAHIALLADGISLISTMLLFVSDIPFDTLIVLSLYLAVAGAICSIISLAKARSIQGILALSVALLILIGYLGLYFTFKDMCVVC